tara:strand:+ start:406 stop:864 length:459 start_codon:yes stop_codon:yes gene_type:complete
MDDLQLISHIKGAPALRFFGIGPSYMPVKGLKKLRDLLNQNAPWANNRSAKELAKMLKNTDVIVTAWKGQNLIGFGRATSDQSFRAILWDVVVDKNYQNLGLGKKIVQTILNNRSIANVERVYLMTTFCMEFYLKLGFSYESNQKLMIFKQF